MGPIFLQGRARVKPSSRLDRVLCLLAPWSAGTSASVERGDESLGVALLPAHIGDCSYQGVVAIDYQAKRAGAFLDPGGLDAQGGHLALPDRGQKLLAERLGVPEHLERDGRLAIDVRPLIAKHGCELDEVRS